MLDECQDPCRHEPRGPDRRPAPGDLADLDDAAALRDLDATQTRMTLRNRGEPAGFGKVAAPVMAAAMRRANDKDLANLKRILEVGR